MTSINTLVEENLDLVEILAARLFKKLGGRVSFDELVAMGNEGLMRAATRYLPDREASFRTFARYRIHGAMVDGLSKIMPQSRRRFRNEQAAQLRPVSAAPFEVAPTEPSLPAAVVDNALIDHLRDALESLPVRERTLVTRCYFGDESIQAAGGALGISKSWASRMHARALTRLAKTLKARGVDATDIAA